MRRSSYLRYEVLRNFRNWRFLILSLAFPLILFFTIGGPNRHVTYDGISFVLYFMTSMMTLGTMAAVISSGARIATERTIGWTRQMRVTPLTTAAYFRAKVLNGYLMALLTIGLISLSGITLGVSLSASQWLTVIGLFLVGLIPFTVLGIMLGHLVNTESLGPTVGGLTSLFSLLGGAYGFQIATSGPLFDLMKALPSYWLVQAGKTALHGGGWPAEGWIVIAIWTVVLLRIAVFAYRRDTNRV